MKRALIVALAALMAFSLVAMAKPSLVPWFEINVPEIINGGVLPPTLDAGVILEGMLSPSWFVDLGLEYNDEDILDPDNDIGLAFESNIGFDELATVNDAGVLVYGCEFTMSCDIVYGENFPNNLGIVEFEPGIMLLGYVGPLSIWGGVDFPWNGNTQLKFRPTCGMRVEFDINL